MSADRVWFCKIGYADSDNLPDGSDHPMRSAVQETFEALTGRRADFCFSGWGASLDEMELEVVKASMERER